MRKRSVGMEVAHTAQNWRKADRLSGSRGSFSFSNQRNRRGFGGGFWGRILAFPGICVRQEKKIVDRTEEWVGHTARAVKTSSTKWGLNTLS